MLDEISGIERIPLGENRGVAAALNVGARRALELGCQWMVTFDQDSLPGRGMMAALWECHQRHVLAAVIGPVIQEKGRSQPYRWVRPHPLCAGWFQRAECGSRDLASVTEVITSGSLVDLAAWSAIGGFDEELFIDYVDVDFCLKVLRAKRTVAVAAAARLHHKLGSRAEGRFLGVDHRPMHHPPFRHYYIARNRVRVWRRHALAIPHWAVFDFCFACYNAFRVFAFERNKWAKAKAMVLGTWDGIRGRFGPLPASRQRAFG